MGTVYRTLCGCLDSQPEPSPAEYPHQWDYKQAWDEWDKIWQREAESHKDECILSYSRSVGQSGGQMAQSHDLEEQLHSALIAWLAQWGLHRYEHPRYIAHDALVLLRDWSYEWADSEDASLIDRVRAARIEGE